MALWGKKRESQTPSIVVLSIAGQENRLPRYSYPLGPGADTIGRGESCTIQLTDPEISREHVSICFDLKAGGYVAADLHSANGTLVNGERLGAPRVLEEGDLIDVGNSRMVFTYRKVDGQLAAFRHLKRHGEQHKGTMLGGQRSEEAPLDGS